ncbi:hypothetical protein Tco_1538633 [Tanacetum coccineum]
MFFTSFHITYCNIRILFVDSESFAMWVCGVLNTCDPHFSVMSAPPECWKGEENGRKAIDGRGDGVPQLERRGHMGCSDDAVVLNKSVRMDEYGGIAGSERRFVRDAVQYGQAGASAKERGGPVKFIVGVWRECGWGEHGCKRVVRNTVSGQSERKVEMYGTPKPQCRWPLYGDDLRADSFLRSSFIKSTSSAFVLEKNGLTHQPTEEYAVGVALEEKWREGTSKTYEFASYHLTHSTRASNVIGSFLNLSYPFSKLTIDEIVNATNFVSTQLYCNFFEGASAFVDAGRGGGGGADPSKDASHEEKCLITEEKNYRLQT